MRDSLATVGVVLKETTEAMARLDVQAMVKKKVVKRKARKPVPRKWMSKQAERDQPLDLGDMDLDETSESSVEVGEVGELAAATSVAPEWLVGHVRKLVPRGGSKPGHKQRPAYQQTLSS